MSFFVDRLNQVDHKEVADVKEEARGIGDEPCSGVECRYEPGLPCEIGLVCRLISPITADKFPTITPIRLSLCLAISLYL
jgi:hypothetical protein